MYFALFMVVILVVTGLVWLLDIIVLRKNRLVGVNDPWYVEYAKSFFPVILLVFTLRSFLVEPFKIPSGSMMPTLLAGDYILVNKFIYGLRVPILNNTFFEVNQPKRAQGDTRKKVNNDDRRHEERHGVRRQMFPIFMQKRCEIGRAHV